MRVEQLAKAIQEPRLLQQLLGGFSEVYSVGVGRNPDKPSEPALIVQIEGSDVSRVPHEVQVGGETVRVVTKTGWKAPRPLAAAR